MLARVMQPNITMNANNNIKEMRMKATTMVRAYVDGFVFPFGSVSDMQVWWDGLKKGYDFSGKTLKIWVSKSSAVGVYDSNPTQIHTL